jgi:PHD/YefM family antitoxin component YafN of YafNO toxin-antitoxin module
MCIDDYEGWLETLEIMSDKKAMQDIKKARKELKQGKLYTFEEVFKRAQRKKKR